MYPDFVTCEDQSAHRTALSAPLFLEQTLNILSGQIWAQLSAKLVSHSLFGGGGGGGGGLGPVLLIATDKGTG